MVLNDIQFNIHLKECDDSDDEGVLHLIELWGFITQNSLGTTALYHV